MKILRWLANIPRSIVLRDIQEVEENIARLEAQIAYWSNKTQANGTIPGQVCETICMYTGDLAALKVRLRYLKDKLG